MTKELKTNVPQKTKFAELLLAVYLRRIVAPVLLFLPLFLPLCAPCLIPRCEAKCPRRRGPPREPDSLPPQAPGGHPAPGHHADREPGGAAHVADRLLGAAVSGQSQKRRPIFAAPSILELARRPSGSSPRIDPLISLIADATRTRWPCPSMSWPW